MLHTVKSFDQDLEKLAKMQDQFCSNLVEQFHQAITALNTFDQDLASRVVKANENALVKQQEIEAFAFNIVALRNPVARDLRWLVSVIRISGYMLEIAHCTNSICNRTLRMKTSVNAELLETVSELFSTTLDMLRGLQSLLKSNDTELAISLRQHDNIVDQLYYKMYKMLLKSMRRAGKLELTHNANLMFAARSTEQIADNIVIISALIYQQATGGAIPLEANDSNSLEAQ